MPARRTFPDPPRAPTDVRVLAIRRCWQILMAEARGKIAATKALGAIMHVTMEGLRDQTSELPCEMCKPERPQFHERFVGAGHAQ